MFQTLCANLALNACTNVFAHPLAVGETRAVASIPAARPKPANFGGLSLLSATPGEQVQLVRIRRFRAAGLPVLKIDVEGMEVDSLRGAAETIRRTRPVLYVENDRQQHSATLIALLLGFGYQLLLAHPPLFARGTSAATPRTFFPASPRSTCLPAAPAAAPGFRLSRGQGPDRIGAR